MTPQEAELAVRNRPLPEVVALLERLKLPADLLTYARGMNHMLDRGFLCFGRIYKLKKTITANRHGSLAKNDQVRFLGAYVFPYDNGLRLYFEPVDQPGTQCLLEFEGNFPESEGYVRMLDDQAERVYFMPYSVGSRPDQRTIELLQAELCLRQTAYKTAELSAQAYEDAQPAYQKKLLALQEEHKVYGPATKAVYGVDPQSIHEKPTLDFGSLRFGRTYALTQTARGNRSGHLATGTRVIFFGAETRYEEEVTLAFECEDGSRTDLVYYPTGPQDAADCQPMLHPERFFQEQQDGLTARAQLLSDLRGVFLDLIQERQAAQG